MALSFGAFSLIKAIGSQVPRTAAAPHVVTQPASRPNTDSKDGPGEAVVNAVVMPVLDAKEKLDKLVNEITVLLGIIYDEKPTVSIQGKVASFKFANQSNKEKLLRVIKANDSWFSSARAGAEGVVVRAWSASDPVSGLYNLTKILWKLIETQGISPGKRAQLISREFGWRAIPLPRNCIKWEDPSTRYDHHGYDRHVSHPYPDNYFNACKSLARLMMERYPHERLQFFLGSHFLGITFSSPAAAIDAARVMDPRSSLDDPETAQIFVSIKDKGLDNCVNALLKQRVLPTTTPTPVNDSKAADETALLPPAVVNPEWLLWFTKKSKKEGVARAEFNKDCKPAEVTLYFQTPECARIFCAKYTDDVMVLPPILSRHPLPIFSGHTFKTVAMAHLYNNQDALFQAALTAIAASQIGEDQKELDRVTIKAADLKCYADSLRGKCFPGLNIKIKWSYPESILYYEKETTHDTGKIQALIEVLYGEKPKILNYAWFSTEELFILFNDSQDAENFSEKYVAKLPESRKKLPNFNDGIEQRRIKIEESEWFMLQKMLFDDAADIVYSSSATVPTTTVSHLSSSSPLNTSGSNTAPVVSPPRISVNNATTAELSRNSNDSRAAPLTPG